MKIEMNRIKILVVKIFSMLKTHRGKYVNEGCKQIAIVSMSFYIATLSSYGLKLNGYF